MCGADATIINMDDETPWDFARRTFLYPCVCVGWYVCICIVCWYVCEHVELYNVICMCILDMGSEDECMYAHTYVYSMTRVHVYVHV